MRVATWNVNSIRSRVDAVVAWTEQHRPDVLLLQETKCVDSVFPSEPFEAMGYDVAHHGRDHWNGVAIISRVGIEAVHRGFEQVTEPPHDECRLISASCAGVRCHSLYVPNGRTLDDPHYRFKLEWLGHLAEQLGAEAATGAAVLAAGDFNVAPADADIYDPSRWRGKTHASPPERAALARLQDAGFTDLVRHFAPEPGVFTWWSYRPGQFESNRGLRIDHVYTSATLTPRVASAHVDTIARGAPRPSDHAPVVVELADPRR